MTICNGRIAISYDNSMHIFDRATKRWKKHFNKIKSAIKRNYVVVYGEDGSWIYDLKKTDLNGVKVHGSLDHIYSIDPINKRLVGWLKGNSHNTVIIELFSGKIIRQFSDHSGITIYPCHYHSRGSHRPGFENQIITLKSPVSVLSDPPYKPTNAKIEVWSVETGKRLQSISIIECPILHQYVDGERVVLTYKEHVDVIDLRSGYTIFSVPKRSPGSCFNPYSFLWKNKLVVPYGLQRESRSQIKKFRYKIWDVETEDLLYEINHVFYSPRPDLKDGKVLFYTNSDNAKNSKPNQTTIYDLENDIDLGTFPYPKAFLFEKILVGCDPEEGKTFFVDVYSRQHLQTIEGTFYNLTMSGKEIVTLNDEKKSINGRIMDVPTIKIWNIIKS